MLKDNEMIMTGVVIESPNTVLRNEARAAFDAWHAPGGGTQENRHRYAVALKRWGEATRSTQKVRHAEYLLSADFPAHYELYH